TPEGVEAELEHLGPEALGLGEERLGEILAEQPRRLHSLLRDQRVIAGIGRAWANEILHAARLSPFAPAQGLSPGQGSQLASPSGAGEAGRTPRPTASTPSCTSPASSAARRSSASTSTSTRSSTAHSARRRDGS